MKSKGRGIKSSDRSGGQKVVTRIRSRVDRNEIESRNCAVFLPRLRAETATLDTAKRSANCGLNSGLEITPKKVLGEPT